MAGIRVHPSGRWFAFTGENGGFAYLLNRDYPYVFRAHKSTVTGLALSPDGQWMASSSREGQLRLWPLSPDVATEPETSSLSLSAHAIGVGFGESVRSGGYGNG